MVVTIEFIKILFDQRWKLILLGNARNVWVFSLVVGGGGGDV